MSFKFSSSLIQRKMTTLLSTCIYCLEDSGEIYKNNLCKCIYTFHRECIVKCAKEWKFACPLCRNETNLRHDSFAPFCCKDLLIIGDPDNDLAEETRAFQQKWMCLMRRNKIKYIWGFLIGLFGLITIIIMLILTQ
jgi:hypothetical protein